ncbi:MAG: hypothetical protein RDU25_05210 [Patescibacteria group bacterium]|nr:hypothetical protein [Patescibacteria group bacterium]
MGTFAQCPRCHGFLLPVSHVCVNPVCSTNRPTARPNTSKPAVDAEKTAGEGKPKNPCSFCRKDMPDKARYCPHCRAPTRPSATAAYHVWEHSHLVPPPLPRIDEDDDGMETAPPTHPDAGHSGFRRKVAQSDDDLEPKEASCGGKKPR